LTLHVYSGAFYRCAAALGRAVQAGGNCDNSDDSREFAEVGYITPANFVGKYWRVLHSTAGNPLRLFKVIQ